MKSKYSEPKIYTGGVPIKTWSKLSKNKQQEALAKEWYVYYSYRHPNTGKLIKQTAVKGGANRYKNKKDRFQFLEVLRNNLSLMLSKGFSPYEHNPELEAEFFGTPVSKNKNKEVLPKKGTSNNTEQQPAPTTNVVEDKKEPSMTVREAMNFALDLKSKVVSKSTIQNYKSRSGKFLVWLEKNYAGCKHINQVTKKHILEFLNSILEVNSVRNRNNYRTDLSSIFQLLEDNDIVTENFVKKISVIKTKPNRHQRFTEEQYTEIFEYLKEEDPHLLLYIKFVGYNFLRPIEVNRLRIGDVNLSTRRLQFVAKNSPLKTKIIPELLVDEIPDLSGLEQDHFLFTPEGIGGEWEATEENRRDHFSKRFKQVVKDYFGYNENHGLYSFRHTFITKVYREIRKEKSPHAAKSDLMQITGHTSMTALEQYLRDIDAELPQDYSAHLKN